MRGRKVPERLTLAQCRSLLVAARDYQDGRALPYFVAGLFGGVRPVETTRLSWDLFDLTRTRRIDLGEHIAKMGEHRYVSLTPNMLEWLEPHALKKTPFRISRLDFDTVRKLAGITHWPDDVLRHTAVSNFLAAGHSDREATERHGHSVSVMLKHYRDRVTPEDAKEFWTLAPANVQSTPIQLHKAA
jgi:integrase